jgi:UDPglucose--hexose-1-phosphate uridylyltransferase
MDKGLDHLPPMDKTELRLDPLTEDWTIFSSARATPPAFPGVHTEMERPSPFVAGSERYAAHSLYTERDSQDAWRVRVIPNRSPILRVEGDPAPQAEGFYDRMDGVGAHEVIVEDSGAAALEELALPSIEKVLLAWKWRMLDLLRDPRMRAFCIVKNVGAAAGANLTHSVSQLLAMAFVPPVLRRKLRTARSFFDRKGRSIFADLLAEEIRSGSRLVYENSGFIVFCPYAARAPFEMAIYPKRQCADFHGSSDQEITQLADALKTALGKLNQALDHPPYNLLLHTAPVRTARRDQWATIDQDFRWHLEILPRLQHPGGVELATGCWVNSVWPETAAEYLRATEVAP